MPDAGLAELPVELAPDDDPLDEEPLDESKSPEALAGLLEEEEGAVGATWRLLLPKPSAEGIVAADADPVSVKFLLVITRLPLPLRYAVYLRVARGVGIEGADRLPTVSARRLIGRTCKCRR